MAKRIQRRGGLEPKAVASKKAGPRNWAEDALQAQREGRPIPLPPVKGADAQGVVYRVFAAFLQNEADGAVRTAGDVVFLGKLLLLFADSNAGEEGRLREFAGRGEWESAKHAAHSLKGSSGNLGLLRLAEQARWTELALAEYMAGQSELDENALRSAVLSLADLASETMELARRQGTILGKEAEEDPS